jgi:hypothetical protein
LHVVPSEKIADFMSIRDRGTKDNISVQSAIISGDTLEKLLKDPKVTYPSVRAGGPFISGLSFSGE